MAMKMTMSQAPYDSTASTAQHGAVPPKINHTKQWQSFLRAVLGISRKYTGLKLHWAAFLHIFVRTVFGHLTYEPQVWDARGGRSAVEGPSTNDAQEEK